MRGEGETALIVTDPFSNPNNYSFLTLREAIENKWHPVTIIVLKNIPKV